MDMKNFELTLLILAAFSAAVMFVSFLIHNYLIAVISLLLAGSLFYLSNLVCKNCDVESMQEEKND